MHILTEMQQSGQVVHVIAATKATPLIESGHLREAIIQPAPPRGKIAVNLTTLGKSYSAPEPVEQSEPE